MAAGLIGGLPGAGATLGTVVNLRAGGRTPVSGALRAAILLALVLGLGRYVEAIPHAALAGILMKVGWDIIDWRFLTRIHRVQREHLLVMLITLGLTVFLDLITAVAIGLIAAGMASARQFERLQMDSVVSVPLLDRSFFGARDDEDTVDAFSARVGLVALRGSFTVASANKLISTISVDIRDHEVVILDFSDTVFMDDSAALVVEQLIDTAIAEKHRSDRDGPGRTAGDHAAGAECAAEGSRRPICEDHSRGAGSGAAVAGGRVRQWPTRVRRRSPQPGGRWRSRR